MISQGEAALIQSLRMVPFFAAMQDEDLRWVVGNAGLVLASPGQVLFRQGDLADKFYVLLNGYVELSVHAPVGGDRSILEILETGEVFAHAAVLNEEAYPVSASVLEQARLLVIDGRAFRQRLEQRFDLVLLMLAQLSGRLRGLIGQLTELKMKNTSQRLAGFLLSLTDAEDGEVTVSIPYDKRLVADKLGMKPETLSRAFAKLRSLGVESGKADSFVRIADIAGLRGYCHSFEGEA